MTFSVKTMALPLLLLATPAFAAPDRQFLSDAIKGDNAEVAMGHLALDKSRSARVRDFGRMLVADHGAHKVKLVRLGASLHVPATNAVPPEAARESRMLGGMRGAAFDKAFKQHMIDGHRANIAKYEAQARSGQSDRVRALARDTLPTLRKHLAAAQAL